MPRTKKNIPVKPATADEQFIDVHLPEREYSVHIVNDKFCRLPVLLTELDCGNDLFIISNRKIYGLYGRMLAGVLQDTGFDCFFHLVPDAEASKSVEQFIKSVTVLSQRPVRGKPCIIALGGGVIGDLAGFLAASYKRGIPFIQIPTTLLAQVDSSIGGKTGVDLPAGKNLLGAFYQPRLIYCNIGTLSSLPSKHLSSGMAEVVKYAMLFDEKFFTYLENNTAAIMRSDIDVLRHIIYTSIGFKAGIIEQDEYERSGLRSVLNFGHTVGHALEAATGYRRYTHGQAVSIGMVAAAAIAQAMGIFSATDQLRLETLLTRLQLPTRARNLPSREIFWQAFRRDKKFSGTTVRLVLPTRVGHAIVTADVPDSVITSVVSDYME